MLWRIPANLVDVPVYHTRVHNIIHVHRIMQFKCDYLHIHVHLTIHVHLIFVGGARAWAGHVQTLEVVGVVSLHILDSAAALSTLLSYMLLFLLLACLLPYTYQMAQRPVIGKPAPAWSGQAVVNGEIKTISLKDFQGEEYYVRAKFATG